jgi:predicted LPLAT superfamily acyltransferase
MSANMSRQEWLAQPERSNPAAMRLMVWLALRLGRGVTRLLLYPLSLYFLAFSTRARRASGGYLARVLGRAPGFAGRLRHYHSFAAIVLDRVYLLKGRENDFDLRVHGMEAVTPLIAAGRGGFMLGAHLGSFEAVRARSRFHPGLRVRMLMYEENARQTNAVLNAINPQFAAEIIALGRPDSMLRLQASLECGEFVGMLGDRTLGDDSVKRCPFLGEPAAFGEGPFRIAAMLGRPLVLMLGLYRGGRRYDLHFELLADFSSLARESRESRQAAIDEALRRYVARLEHYCREAPYNWFNFYDFWR